MALYLTTKPAVDLVSNQSGIRGKKSFNNKINIQTSDSSRTYYLEAGADNTFNLDSNPSGSFRSVEFEFRPRANIDITRDGYSLNNKLRLSSNGTSGTPRSFTGNYYGQNNYVTVDSSHTTISTLSGVYSLADVESNLSGTTVDWLSSIHGGGVSARTTTVVNNAAAIKADAPNHGTNRYAGYFAAPTGGSGENLSIKALGNCDFQGTISINGKKITYSATEPINPNSYDIWHELSTESQLPSGRVKQSWFRSGDSNPTNRRWISLDLYKMEVLLADGSLSAIKYIPISFSNIYGFAIETAFIQCFIGSEDITQTGNDWNIQVRNGYGATANQFLFSANFSNTDTNAVNGSNVKKTFVNVGYTVNGVTSSNYSFQNTANPQQVLWLLIQPRGATPVVLSERPTMFFEYRLVRP